jgi:DNA-binding NarL/FixJ family response regulator
VAELIRVILADDQVLVRSGFRALLDAEADIEVVGEAVDGAEAVRLAAELHPDIVLMDIRMPGVDGLTAAREIAARSDLDSTRVLVLTTFELDEYVYEALHAGASGFLVKHTEPAELIRAVRVIAAGEALLSPSITRRLISTFTEAPGPTGATAAAPREAALLTDREREVVSLVADGLSNEEIAGRWFVSNATVRTHVSRAMTKLSARDRAQLVVFAYRYGLATIAFGSRTSGRPAGDQPLDVEPGSQR